MGIETAIAALKADPDLAEGWVEWRTIPAQAARFGSWPRALDERLLRALALDGIEQPFSHEATLKRTRNDKAESPLPRKSG